MSDVMALLGFVALLVLLVPRLWREQPSQKDHDLDSQRLLSSARERRAPSPV
jgi:hypothetical protein